MREFKLLLMPPLVCLLPLLLGLWLQRRRPRLGKGLIAAAVLSLWLLSAPIVSGHLFDLLQADRPVEPDAELPSGAAIVVLSAGTTPHAVEYGGPTVGARTLVRLRYGCRLAKRSGLPLLVSGGSSWHGLPPLAEMMAEVAREDFGVEVRYVEPLSTNTFENATRSVAMLRYAGIERVVLVTEAFHMPRARRAFEACGVEVTAAPTGFAKPPRLSVAAFLPSYKGLTAAALAGHEALGRLWLEWFQIPSLDDG